MHEQIFINRKFQSLLSRMTDPVKCDRNSPRPPAEPTNFPGSERYPEWVISFIAYVYGFIFFSVLIFKVLIFWLGFANYTFSQVIPVFAGAIGSDQLNKTSAATYLLFAQISFF